VIDALVRFLNEDGYLPVFLPRTGLIPPDVYTLGKAGKLARNDALRRYLPKGVTLPHNESGAMANIELHKTSSKNAKAAATFLQNALACIGVTSFKSDLSFAGSSSFVFAFTEVTYERAPGLDHALAKLDLGAIPDETIKGGKVHIAYEYLYAKSLRMMRSDGEAFSTNLSADAVRKLFDLGASGVVHADSASVIRFTTTGKPAAFAYKAGRLVKHKNHWELAREEIAKGSVGETKLPYLPARGVVLTAREDQ
jgi:hypothetical protein